MRYRRVLVRLDLDRVLFETVTWQLDASGVVVRCGMLVHKTLLPSANIRHEAEARWVGHKRRRLVNGCKAHVTTDKEAVLIRKVQITTANLHDAAA